MSKGKTDRARIRELENALSGVLQLAAKHMPHARDTVGYDDFKRIYNQGYAALYGTHPGNDVLVNQVIAMETPIGRHLSTTKNSWLD